MIEEPFAIGHSVIHTTDPRIRVIAAVVFSFAVALCYGFTSLMFAFAFSVGSVLACRVRLGQVIKRLALVNVFVLIFWFVLPFTYPGGATYSLGPLTLHQAGIVFAAKITLKSNAILLILIAFIATMTLATLGHTLGRLKVPEKLVFLLMITYRYVFVIAQEYQKIIKSIKIRGFTPKTTLHTYKTFAYVVGMLLIRASERADRVYNAMRCRGFKGTYYSLTEFRADRRSWIFLVTVFTATALVIAMEILFRF